MIEPILSYFQAMNFLFDNNVMNIKKIKEKYESECS